MADYDLAILGVAAADPWRSRPAGAQGLSARTRRACRARHLAADRAASGAPDALCDPRAFGRASVVVAALGAVALRPAGLARDAPGIGDDRCHAPSRR